MEKAYLITIGGRVTGVGFRYSVLEWSRELPQLKGYVRNIGYGEVEVLLQGPENKIEAMISKLRRGPAYARVDSFNINQVPPEPGLDSFIIR